MSIYDYSIPTPDGGQFDLADNKGKVMIIVNTATGCGFTPHYTPLEEMFEKYHDKGLEIVDIPCNQFMNQAPESDEEIHQFCTLHYNTKFPQMKKSDVNGENALPVYGYLKSQQGFKGFGDSEIAGKMDGLLKSIDPDYENNPDIKWNFTKFVVDRDGNVVARFEPTEDMGKLDELVASLL